MFQRSKLCVASLLAVGAAPFLAIPQAVAQVAERVEITGSNIKRLTAEGPLPVATISKEDIE
jgi:iron complex outermembrane receptor protein